jgi:hypothetical protein
MVMLFPNSPIDEWIIALGAVLVAVAVTFKFGVAAYRAIARIEATLGTDEKGRTVIERLDTVEKQVFPNGGSSLADKVKIINDRQVQLEAKVGTVESLLSTFIGSKNDVV